MKKIVALILISVGIVMALPDSITISVVARDFQANHPDFENFHDARSKAGEIPRTCFNTPLLVEADNVAWYSTITNGLVNRIDLIGQPMMYGMLGETNGIMGGRSLYHHTNKIRTPYNEDGFDVFGNTVWKGDSWANSVAVTKGMVGDQLMYSDPSDPLTAYPVKIADACDNTFFDQWFQDYPGINKTVKFALSLQKDPASSVTNPQYYINSDENSCDASGTNCTYAKGGFFPLDAYEGVVDDYGVPVVWGKSTYRIWCDPTPGGYRDDEAKCATLEGAYDANGRPLGFDVTDPLARNYHYTMMGYAEFTYNSGQQTKFAFSGDDDMWIFIDGKLEADLGGVHEPAEAIVDMDYLAALYGWETASQHDLHFFYADRQSDGSNLKIYTTLNEVSDSPFAAPKIKLGKVGGDNPAEMLIYSSAILSDATIASINAQEWGTTPLGSDLYAGPIHLESKNLSTGLFEEKNLVVTGIEYNGAAKERRDGYIYKVTFDISCAGISCAYPNVGDSIAFRQSLSTENYPGLPRIISVDNVPTGSTRENAPVEVIISVGGGTVPIEVSSNPRSPDGPTADILNGNTSLAEIPNAILPGAIDPLSGTDPVLTDAAKQLANGSLESIPPSLAGEIILSPLPYEEILGTWDNEIATYGSFPSSTNGSVGAVVSGNGVPMTTMSSDVTKASDGGVQFIKSGFVSSAGDPNQLATSGTSSSLCTEDGSASNCLTGIMFETEQGFKINVMVYDAIGNFVTQYKESVTNEEMWAVQLQAPGSEFDISGNGKVIASVGVYPNDRLGRKIGNGAYILVVDVLKLRRIPVAQTTAETEAIGSDEGVAYNKKTITAGAIYYEKPIRESRTRFVKKIGYMRFN